MSKPKYYLKPVWMLKNQLKGKLIHGMSIRLWEDLRKKNQTPDISDKYPAVGNAWIIPHWGLTKRLSMELRRPISDRDIITLP